MATGKMRVLVTGHAGYLGANLSAKLIALGHHVVAVDLTHSKKPIDGEFVVIWFRF